MVTGFLLNRRSTAETTEFVRQATVILEQIPEFGGKVKCAGYGTVRGFEILGEGCEEIQSIAERIMKEVPFPDGLRGDYDLSFSFRPDLRK